MGDMGRGHHQGSDHMGAVEAHVGADLGIGQRHDVELGLAVQQQVAAHLDAVHVQRSADPGAGHQQVAGDRGARQIDLVERARLHEQVAAHLQVLQPRPALDLALPQGEVAGDGGAEQVHARQVAVSQVEIVGDADALEIEAAADRDGAEIGAAADGGAHHAEIDELRPVVEFQIGAELRAIEDQDAFEARAGEGDVGRIAEPVEIDIPEEVRALEGQFEARGGIAQGQRIGEMGTGDMDAEMGHLAAHRGVEQQRLHELRRDVVGERRAGHPGGEIGRLAGANLRPGPDFRLLPAGFGRRQAAGAVLRAARQGAKRDQDKRKKGRRKAGHEGAGTGYPKGKSGFSVAGPGVGA